ncbi:hypothetical protein [Aquimarina sediminis]|uniref:hypothetical protein n=1 Tax=Aquimarina sediminis TaxID=2070536 RepID=UPI000CA01233|nr:hypothetical protein [Aquimarina sediminis]
MKKKWYFGTLITAFALLVAIKQQTVVPNQEIVLEFLNGELSSPEAQNAIAVVKKQLQSIGVEDTKISKELGDGKLKITYYSNADVEDIKKLFSEGQNVEIDHVFYDQNEDDNELPLSENSKEYSLDVYEIQKNTDFDTDFNGKYVLEAEQKHGGNSSFNVYSFVAETDDTFGRLIKVAQKVNTNIAIAIDNTSYKIPEVRAGPIT